MTQILANKHLLQQLCREVESIVVLSIERASYHGIDFGLDLGDSLVSRS
jgi:hypothetical protein